MYVHSKVMSVFQRENIARFHLELRRGFMGVRKVGKRVFAWTQVHFQENQNLNDCLCVLRNLGIKDLALDIRETPSREVDFGLEDHSFSLSKPRMKYLEV